MTWREFLEGFFKCVFVPVVLVTATFALAYLIIPAPRLYTVKHGENVHRNAEISVYGHGIISGVDSEGRKFFYRDGWEAISEVKHD